MSVPVPLVSPIFSPPSSSSSLRPLLLLFFLLLLIAPSAIECQSTGDEELPVNDGSSEPQAEAPATLNPKFLEKNRTLSYSEGDTVRLRCRVQDLGPYVILWYKGADILYAGQQNITRNERIYRIYDSDNGIEIKDLRLKDADEYKCTVTTSPMIEQRIALRVVERSKNEVTSTDGEASTGGRNDGSGNPNSSHTTSSSLSLCSLVAITSLVFVLTSFSSVTAAITAGSPSSSRRRLHNY